MGRGQREGPALPQCGPPLPICVPFLQEAPLPASLFPVPHLSREAEAHKSLK